MRTTVLAIFLSLAASRVGIAQELMSAETWMRATVAARHAFVYGFIDGFTAGYASGVREFADLSKIGAKNITESATMRTFLSLRGGKLDQLESVMTELYKDQANRNIPAARMIWIAHYKIAGADVSQALEQARADAVKSRQQEK